MGRFSGIRSVIRQNGMPLILILAEINMTIILARNMYFYYVMTAYIRHDPISMTNSIFAICLTTVTSLLTIRTMLNLPSASRQSWRGTLRTLIVLIFMSMFYLFFTNHYPIFDIRMVVFLTVVDIAILFLPSVRRYYTPPLTETPEIKEWIKFALLRPKDSVSGYTFVYKDGPKGG